MSQWCLDVLFAKGRSNFQEITLAQNKLRKWEIDDKLYGSTKIRSVSENSYEKWCSGYAFEKIPLHYASIISKRHEFSPFKMIDVSKRISKLECEKGVLKT